MKIHHFDKRFNIEGKSPFTMLTSYDAFSARTSHEAGIDCLLVGDSVGMVVYGFDSTLNVTVEMIARHTEAVRRAAPEAFIIADMPFMSYRKGFESCMNAAEELMRSGANAIKLEGAKGNLEIVRHLVDSGIPVMGHLGLTPQSVQVFGGYKVQARKEEEQQKLIKEAKQLQDAGIFSLVIECVPAHIAETLTQSLQIPTIGIGAGPACDGQVLVWHDLLGCHSGFEPKFLRKYANLNCLVKESINSFVKEVKTGKFPSVEESYS